MTTRAFGLPTKVGFSSPSLQVYNPKRQSLRERFQGASAEEEKKVLASLLVTHAKAMADEKLPFFAQLDDPREGPETDAAALKMA